MAVFPLPPAPNSVDDADRSARLKRSSTIASRPKKFAGACGRAENRGRRAVSRILGVSGVVVDGPASGFSCLSGSTCCVGVF